MSDLTSLTLSRARQKLSAGDISSVELVSAFLERINKAREKLNVFVTLNVHAVEHAHEADEFRQKNPSVEGKPLLGIPIAVKDNFLTKGLRTTASSKLLDNFIPPYESTVTKRLLEAGAIILGKTNMDAWAHGSSTETSDYGVTRNPWNTNCLPGGSSGGSAAAVAADLCIAAIGSETAGSIRQPAAWCGCVGLKPSYGRVSRYGVVAMASSTDSPGPMTKTVEDAETLLQIIAGHDRHDATSMPGAWQPAENRSSRNIRIGIVTDYFLAGAQEGINECVMKAIDLLKKEGYETKDISLIDPTYAIADYTIIQRAEVSSNLARYDGIRYGNGREAFAQEAKRRIMLGTYVLSSGYQDKYYRKAQQVRTAIIEDFASAFRSVDVLIAPTSPSVALPIGATEGASMFGELQDVLVEASSMAGLPGISIPCGFIDGLPVGMQITGNMGDEAVVFAIAKKYEELTNWHVQKPTV